MPNDKLWENNVHESELKSSQYVGKEDDSEYLHAAWSGPRRFGTIAPVDRSKDVDQ